MPQASLASGIWLGEAVRRGRYRLIEFFEYDSLELYDLTNDLRQTHNLATEKLEVASQWQQRQAKWRQARTASMPSREDSGKK